MIDVSKITKDRLYKGKKGTYMNITIFISDDKDNFGNNGFVIESLSKEERQQGMKGNIIGNVKYPGRQSSEEVIIYEEPINRQNDWEGDLPF